MKVPIYFYVWGGKVSNLWAFTRSQLQVLTLFSKHWNSARTQELIGHLL